MKLDRWTFAGYVLWIFLIMAGTGLMMFSGHIGLARWLLTLMFMFGAVFLFAGYYRYIPPGPTMPALLAMGLGKSASFAILGLGFLAISIGQPSTSPVNAYLVATYVCFAGAAAAQFFTGVFVFVGRGRGWIYQEVYKWPWGKAAKRHHRKQRQ
jgi:hypothetical protein